MPQTARLRVHIGYVPVQDAAKRGLTVDVQQIGRVLGIDNVKVRMGIVTGDIDPDKLEQLRSRDGVRWVEIDRERRLR